jgi:GAF domain-containing protein
MDRVAGAAKAVFGPDTCCLAYVDPRTERVVSLTWAEGTREVYRHEAWPRPDGRTAHVLHSKQPLLWPDASDRESPHPPKGMVANGLQSIASVPLIHGGRVVGVLHCNYYRRARPFGEGFMTRCAAFTARAAMALDRADRDREGEIWQELDRLIATVSDSAQLYQLLAEHACRALHADLAVFYPFDVQVTPTENGSLAAEIIRVGELQAPWREPTGGMGGGVYEELDRKVDGVLIVNDLDSQKTRYHSHLSSREGIKAFVGLRLDVTLEDESELLKAGYLFLEYRTPTAFERADLIGLQLAGTRVAAAVQRLHMLAAAREQRSRLNRRLRAVVDIFRVYREHRDVEGSLERIAAAAKDALDMDTCTLLEYDAEKGRFYRRGAAGLERPKVGATLSHELKTRFLDKTGPTVIADVEQDVWARSSGFVRREQVRSVVVYPLHIEAQALGLMFANYRRRKTPTASDLEAIGLLADLAAMILYETKLREALSETEMQLQRRALLARVSMVETSWRHSQIVKAAAIRNYTAVLLKRLERRGDLPGRMEAVPETVDEIDRLAAEIADAPPRVPQSWEMEAELVPLASLLQGVARREGKASPLRQGPAVGIRAKVKKLEGVEVRARRRWLIYALEALLQNSRNAMPDGGQITIKGRRRGKWAEVRVKDTGVGVPEAIQGKLFKEMIPREEDQLGMGIGSLLVATIIEEHEGSIELKKPGPGGTVICIRLPVVKKEES